MKKLIAITLMTALAVMTVGPALSVAGPGSVETQLNPLAGGGSSADPIRIKAKWEMKGSCFDVAGAGTTQDPYVYTYNKCTGVGEGRDDNYNSGAQFSAPNQWGIDMDYTVCAVVHGPEQNIANIDRVIADIYYPDTPMHLSGHSVGGAVCNQSSIGISNDDGYEIDNPTGGCSAKIEQNFLHKLTQLDGINLVCNAIHDNNNDLIEWASGENYDMLCNATNGQLTKGFAAVYCADKHLIWEDPAGMYKVDVVAFDTSNYQSVVFTNHFQYMDTMGYQIDFDKVNYGDVKICEHKRVYGDKCYWPGDSNVPTVRNTGNVRLNMKVAQDDMGLGFQTGSSVWNVEYDARVGDLEADWKVYSPFKFKGDSGNPQYTVLDEVLDLSEIEEMDFSIHVIEKWTDNLPAYSGSMWLSAVQAPFESCTN